MWMLNHVLALLLAFRDGRGQDGFDGSIRWHRRLPLCNAQQVLQSVRHSKSGEPKKQILHLHERLLLLL